MKNPMRTVRPETLSIKERHGLLLSAIGPRPIAWVSSMDEDGNPNLAPFSFFNIFSSNPPILIFSPARSGRTNTTKHTLDNVMGQPEVVVNIVEHRLLDRMVISSLEYEKGVNEFDKAGLQMIKSERVSAMRVAEAPVQLECKVLEVRPLGDQGAAGNLVICEVVMIHVAERVLNENGGIDQHKLDLIGRLGGSWYSKAFGDSLFEVHSNPQMTVVGYDLIPLFARESPQITAQELTTLANHPALPDETSVNDYKLEELSEIFLKLQDSPTKLQDKLLRLCKGHLADGLAEQAWRVLLSYNP